MFLPPTAARDLGLRFVHQDLGLFADLTVAENMALGTSFPTGRLEGDFFRINRVFFAVVYNRFYTYYRISGDWPGV